MYILLSTPNDFKQGCIQHNQMLLLTVRFTSLNTFPSLVSSFGLCLRSPKTWTQRSGNTYITYLWLLSLFLRPHSLLMICANHPQCCCNGEMLMDKDIHTQIWIHTWLLSVPCYMRTHKGRLITFFQIYISKYKVITSLWLYISLNIASSHEVFHLLKDMV